MVGGAPWQGNLLIPLERDLALLDERCSAFDSASLRALSGDYYNNNLEGYRVTTSLPDVLLASVFGS